VGGRLYLQHGPIDIVAAAIGAEDAVERAYAAGALRFSTILGELCAELPLLRRPICGDARPALSEAGRRMWDAAAVYAAGCFITPMAAVAGAVADEICEVMRAIPGVSRVYVNNGGDAALWLGQEASLDVGIVARVDRPEIVAKARILAGAGVRGVATSGWRGRSFSLGIADAVTVFAGSGAAADAAATVIANAVNLPGHEAISRMPASVLQPDSDLGGIAVTVGVGRLSAADVEHALQRGEDVARKLVRQRHIVAAALFLDGSCRVVPDDAEIQRKQFFSEEKNQKTFVPEAAAGSVPWAGSWDVAKQKRRLFLRGGGRCLRFACASA